MKRHATSVRRVRGVVTHRDDAATAPAELCCRRGVKDAS